ncbi:bifunctional protein-serine/threonine kinase/phosphatase [Roseibium aggregatum]|uniref:Bifunctional protein-serine/threonine kinase/phosphatase n=1 Tax=Roseibium aggregatum TaxID=187304 RepID=A0A926P3K2_9HYPH|nr:bifunctional protein-serine/threonine kinase/phosphatase [Roseibium aggregatum]MBD1548563.1 bifunctional protein-serine/threonine kinase/phosphatase [Roseibium aggregatum]
MQVQNARLSLSIGQYSSAGRKAVNQDFHGAMVPDGQPLVLKGAALALADGISTSDVSGIAAETAVKSFLNDYYYTSDAWSARTAATRVISAANSWLHAQNTPGLPQDRGHVCTFDAIVFKGRNAHLFHVGDARIWRMSGDTLEQLTTDHRLHVSEGQSYLARAIGLNDLLDVDYRDLHLSTGDTFVLTTDGVHEFVPPKTIASLIAANDDLDMAAMAIVKAALDAGSDDNLTIQIARIDQLPDNDAVNILEGEDTLPPAPLLRPPSDFEGYRVLRELHASSRSHIYLATDEETGRNVVLKVPSVDLRGDGDYLRRFAMEEWVARRLNSPHVLKVVQASRERRHLFAVTEYVEGRTLRQWMTDNPQPDLETVRGIIEQVAAGLRAFHRHGMLHQDLRPENIMICSDGVVKIIDFGSVLISGVLEAAPGLDDTEILGTHQYSAPEYFLGFRGTERSDQFALGVVAYEMLTGKLPYGGKVSRAHSLKAQNALTYRSAASQTARVPDWVDGALARAVHIDPGKRYEALSEFLEDLRRPNASLRPDKMVPFAERDPVRFWQIVSGVLAILCITLFFQLIGKP